MELKIIVGTKSNHKLRAVAQACKRIKMKPVTINGVKTDSGQDEQPVGFEATYDGAFTRAQSAREQNADHNIAIGIESGIFPFPGKPTLDMAVIVILTKENTQIITTSAGIVFPEEYVTEARKKGFETTTVGSMITKKLGGDPTDPHSVLTNGKISRKDTLVDALAVALKQI